MKCCPDVPCCCPPGCTGGVTPGGWQQKTRLAYPLEAARDTAGKPCARGVFAGSVQSWGGGQDYLKARVLEGEHAIYGQYLRQVGPR